jgi:DNA-binding CsgD family transcriptional regulator
MVVSANERRLFGRRRECAELERLLDTARDGHGAVLVLHGDPGVGKTALLQQAAATGEGFRVIRAVGIEGEMELNYAVLRQLCSPLLGLAEHLPDPQRDALGMAFGLGAGRAPNRSLVGLATLGLVSEAAAHQPLLCIIDDAQWQDDASAKAITFAARRLFAERIAFAFATRDVGAGLTSFPHLHVEPLDHQDARALLQSVLPARLDEPVLERIVAETGGNPLAILELPPGLTPAQLAGGFGLPSPMPLSSGVEQSFARRLARLSSQSRRLLLLAAAEPLGDPALLWRAAGHLAIPESALVALEAEGLLTVDGSVIFRHPLVRSAVYGAAEPTERREVHRVLAVATDPLMDPDRRAWHLAQAALMPDERIASDLEQSAAQAQARGGFAAAAAFLARAAVLTPEPRRRARRSLVAAQTKLQAGALDDALALLASTNSDALDELDRAHVELLRAQIAFVSTHGTDAPTKMLAAARRLTALSSTLSTETYLEALSAALFAGRLASPGARAIDVATAAKAAPQPPLLGGLELLLHGLATFFCDSYEASVPILRRAKDAFDVGGMPVNEQLRWKWLVTISAIHLWDDASWEAISEQHVRIARESGALGELPLALSQRVYVHLFAGELSRAALLVNEIRAATEATGVNLTPYGAVGFVALRGREPEAISLIEKSRADATRRGEGIGLSVIDWAQAVLYNGLGRYDEARDAALRVFEYPHDLGGPINWGMVELIEAAVRAGTPELAADVRVRLAEWAEASGTDWALGVAARSEALSTDDPQAEKLYVEAVERLGRTKMAVDLARAHLLYGEWLRRQRRRVEARVQLRTAHDLFVDFGVEAFAGRSCFELEATGGYVRKSGPEGGVDLTAQEAQIARLARDGLSNPEISARLFISKKTVEYHLHKVFAKLGINSRIRLAQTLPSERGGTHALQTDPAS